MKFVRRAVDLESMDQNVQWNMANGRIELAALRLADATRENPDYAMIVQTSGSFHMDCLGQGGEAHELFARAYELYARLCDCKPDDKRAAQQKWFTACNAAYTASDPAEHVRWVNIAKAATLPGEAPDFPPEAEQELSVSAYHRVLIARVEKARKSDDHGAAAAYAQIALQNCDLNLSRRVWLHKARAVGLRGVDRREAYMREAMGEAYPRSQRLALLEAVAEMKKVVELDPHDAEAWNFLAGWHAIMGDGEPCIAEAERAIQLRPHGYAKAWVNKGNGLYRVGRHEEALACARRGLEEAIASQDQSDIEMARDLAAFAGNSPPEPSMAALAPRIADILNAAVEEGKKFATHAESDIHRVGQTLIKKCQAGRSGPDYVSEVAELLMYFPPEFVLQAVFDAGGNDHEFLSGCFNGALFVAVNASGSQQRDALRLGALAILWQQVPDLVKKKYREAVVLPSAAADGVLTGLRIVMRDELERIHPDLATLIADQDPPTLAELSEVRRGSYARHIEFGRRWRIPI